MDTTPIIIQPVSRIYSRQADIKSHFSKYRDPNFKTPADIQCNIHLIY